MSVSYNKCPTLVGDIDNKGGDKCVGTGSMSKKNLCNFSLYITVIQKLYKKKKNNKVLTLEHTQERVITWVFSYI